MESKDPSFSYTYSAKQQEEIKRIRQKYLPPEAGKLEQLRKLDESATRPGKIVSLILGVLGTLLFGVGMCCTTVWTDYFVPGLVVGVLGLVGIGASYPVYTALVKRERRRLAPQILELSQSLMQ